MHKKSIHLGRVAIALLFSFTLTACTKTMALEADYTMVTEPTLSAGDPIPLPSSDPLLTIRGKVNATNADDSILMGRDDIEAVGVVTYTVTDPFEERPIEYTGVLMRDLLDLWQLDDDATSVRLVALNDYHTEVSISELKELPIMLALQSDGKYMTPDYRGPSMIVYPVHNYEFDLEKVHSNWIWQLIEVEVK